MLRNLLFSMGVLRTVSFGTPVICIGNIMAGGTGKTPMTEYLVSALGPQHIAVLSRGYKRKSKGYMEVQVNSKAMEVGDEPLQIKRKFTDTHVAVDENRRHGIQTIITAFPQTKAVILDDAFQHRYVKASVSIVLIDYTRLPEYDFILPSGRLREPLSALKRADIIVFSKTPVTISEKEKNRLQQKYRKHSRQQFFFTSIAYENQLNPVFPEGKSIELKSLKNTSCILVSGIANDKPFYSFVEKQCIIKKHYRYPDHYAYKASDIEQLTDTNNIIITTEKDAIRMQDIPPQYHREMFFYLPIKTVFLFGHESFFVQSVKKLLV